MCIVLFLLWSDCYFFFSFEGFVLFAGSCHFPGFGLMVDVVRVGAIDIVVVFVGYLVFAYFFAFIVGGFLVGLYDCW